MCANHHAVHGIRPGKLCKDFVSISDWIYSRVPPTCHAVRHAHAAGHSLAAVAPAHQHAVATSGHHAYTHSTGVSDLGRELCITGQCIIVTIDGEMSLFV